VPLTPATTPFRERPIHTESFVGTAHGGALTRASLLLTALATFLCALFAPPVRADDTTLFGTHSARDSSSPPPAAAPALTTVPSATPASPKTRSPAEEFWALKAQEEKLIAKEMAGTNRRDQSSLETLQKRVGISDTNLQERIESAISAVKNSDRFYAGTFPGKLSSYQSEFIRIEAARNKRIEELEYQTTSRLKSSYQTVQRRALAAKDFETATLAATASNYSIVGRWRQSWDKKLRLVVIFKDGRVWHEDENKGGGWNQESPGVFSIRKDGFFLEEMVFGMTTNGNFPRMEKLCAAPTAECITAGR
jgi:hypothetical protein